MVESFETYRSYLFAIAYRMLGSAMEAEDAEVNGQSALIFHAENKPYSS